MLVIGVVLVMLVTVGLIIGIGQYRKAQEVRALVDQGNRYLTELDFDQAIAKYQQALNIDSNNREANLALAECYTMNGESAYAKAIYQSILDQNGREAEAYNKLAELYIRDGEPQKAYELMEEAAGKVSMSKIEDMYALTHPESPVVSLPAGTYSERMKLEIESGDGSSASIYYTTDGTDPTNESIPYNGSIILKNGETELRAIAYNSAGFPSEIVTGRFNITVPDVEIKFTDPYMESIIRQILGIYGDTPVYNDDIEQITSLCIAGNSYYSINSSDTLTFDGYNIIVNGYSYYSTDSGSLTTLSDIATLPFLETLVVAYQDALDISALSGAKTLKALSLIGNNLTGSDLDALSGLTRLNELCLGWNSIEDISALSGLTSLTSLSLWGNDLTEIDAVKKLEALEYLDFSDNAVSDIAPVKGLDNLQELWMYRNLVTSIRPVTELPSLSVLMVRDNPITDAKSVREIYSQLTRLDTDLLGLGDKEDNNEAE